MLNGSTPLSMDTHNHFRFTTSLLTLENIFFLHFLFGYFSKYLLLRCISEKKPCRVLTPAGNSALPGCWQKGKQKLRTKQRKPRDSRPAAHGRLLFSHPPQDPSAACGGGLGNGKRHHSERQTSTTSYGLGHPLGQLGSPVLAVSHPSFSGNPRLFVGGAEKPFLIPRELCSAITKTSPVLPTCSWHRTTAQPRTSSHGENQLSQLKPAENHKPAPYYYDKSNIWIYFLVYAYQSRCFWQHKYFYGWITY